MFSRHHLRILPFLVCGAIFSDYRGLVFSGQSDKALQVFKQKIFNYNHGRITPTPPTLPRPNARGTQISPIEISPGRDKSAEYPIVQGQSHQPLERSSSPPGILLDLPSPKKRLKHEFENTPMVLKRLHTSRQVPKNNMVEHNAPGKKENVWISKLAVNSSNVMILTSFFISVARS